MSDLRTVEVPIKGMDCAECTQHVGRALRELAGVESAQVYLASEKAVLRLDPKRVQMGAIRKAVERAGYSVPPAEGGTLEVAAAGFPRAVLTLLAVVFAAVLFVVVVGEWLGLFASISDHLPWPVSLAFVVVAGYPVFRNVVKAALGRQVISHTLMTFGVLAAIAVGEWATAAVVVAFMRIGDYVERFTAERARRAVKDLTAMAPQTARVERDGETVEVPLSEVRVGEVVVVHPGERIPVDGVVIHGQATVDQAAITGESMPVEAVPGSKVYAASIARLGALGLRAERIGEDSTFGRVIRLVEEAEGNRAEVQRLADRFSAFYLPVVLAVAVLTLLIGRNPLATAAVLVVACSCSFALATPIAVLASIGAGARRGLLIKGGGVLEALSQVDVMLIDKTGTLTLGKPEITDVVAWDGFSEDRLLTLAASAERHSEHPLAEAVRAAARARGLALGEPEEFEALPGLGVRVRLQGARVSVGARRMLGGLDGHDKTTQVEALEAQGKSVLLVACEGEVVGLLAAADTLRPEVPEAVEALRHLGLKRVELLTGDNQRTAAELAARLGIDFRAELLPEDKIEIVRDYQAAGHLVAMVGDGVNDAPALAQAHVGIAMGAAGSDVAVEAAHLALMRDDWGLVPEAIRVARRTMQVVRMNIAFTVAYNVAGLTLAAFGFLPPVVAAAAQSLPDLGILANASRLLKR